MTTAATNPFADFTDMDLALRRWTDASRQAGNDYLDLYVQGVEQLTELQVETAAATNLPLVTKLVDAQVAVTREVAGTYVTAARDLLKA